MCSKIAKVQALRRKVVFLSLELNLMWKCLPLTALWGRNHHTYISITIEIDNHECLEADFIQSYQINYSLIYSVY